MSLTMNANLADQGALLVHPSKAYILRHLELPERYARWWEVHVEDYYSASSSMLPESGLRRYIDRLHASVETLFGPVNFDFHRPRDYPTGQLDFHSDHNPDNQDELLIRMVTCIHNATSEDRLLHFRRPLWTGHTESFTLPIPGDAILAFSGSLITDYEHGIPIDGAVETYRSIVTRFSKWEGESA